MQSVDNTIQVVAALIRNQKGEFLICQRPANKSRALLWEFVGGKVEPGETLRDALIRECHEELAVTVNPTQIFDHVTHAYDDVRVDLTLFLATITNGTLQKLEHNDLRWVTPLQMLSFDFCPADYSILQKIQRQFGADEQ